LTPEEATEKPFIASMGIYVFKKDVLIDLLTNVRLTYLLKSMCSTGFVPSTH
jgi:ADP-glucose pyrophosphorylase